MHMEARASLTDNAANAIRTEIVSGRWAVGDKLPNEATLSKRLSVSRGTVREAVRVLAAQGFLETRQGSGTYVLSATDSRPTLAMARRAGLRDQFEARCALEVEAARLAAQRCTPATIAVLRQLLAERGNFDGIDKATFVARDLAFHKAVVAASQNRALIEIYDFFSASIADTIRSTIDEEVPEPDIKAHADIVDALEAGDVARADAAVRRFMAPIFTTLDRLLLS